MNNFERITASPEALGDFLGALPILSGPWDDDFHRVFCDSCDAENCDAENCAHQAERNSPTWWLKRAYTGSGPVKTDSTNPYKLADGFYIIRKLTVTECKRLQTVPDTYAFPVSDTQAYKMLGNGWTVDVIAHIMSHFTGLTEEPVEVLSMYDGMSCGHIALDKLGAEITAYYATEIDKYAVQTTQHNFPDTVQLGDAFQVRAEDWHLPEPAGMEVPANG